MRSTQDKAILAAHNNADLCGAIMAASGVSTERDELVYFCIDTPLPYYPKIVTLEPSSSSELNYRVRGHSGIKDSFSCLDRDALDLRIAFEASWIWADAGLREQSTKWTWIESVHDLSNWHQAWNGNDSTLDQMIFPPKCLNDPNLVFLARMSGTIVEAGCIANLSKDVVGMSNVFSTKSNDSLLYAEALAAVSSVGPHLPVVGYERGNDLDAACRAGFKVIGPLRILVR